MNRLLEELLVLLEANDGITDKAKLTTLVADRFALTKDRSVLYCKEFALRFSASANSSFSNTVLSLSTLYKFDDRPFVVCVVTPRKNYALLGNTSFLKKISHSSQQLRVNNIRGSFNGTDIMREFAGVTNCGANFDRLFDIHGAIGFDGNLARLVEATNNISPSGKKFPVGDEQRMQILDAPTRAARFLESREAKDLKAELDRKVEQVKNEILLAALIENVNVRGRIIEYLIAGDDERLRQRIIEALRNRTEGIPPFKTENSLGDYTREFDEYCTETDVKTKLMVLNSNPKAYNLDKMLEFLATKRSVFLFYFVGIEPGKIVNTVLVSMFQERLLDSTILLKHWAGRNSRGVSQFEGKAVSQLILHPEDKIDERRSREFLEELIAL